MTEDEIAMIRDAAERIFADHCERHTLAAASQGQWPGALWDAVEGASLPLAMISEEGGGAMLSAPAALSLVGVAAYHAAPIPFAETLLAAWLLDRAGMAVPMGPLSFASISSPALREGGAWRVAGTARRVPWGRDAQLLVLAEAGDRPRLFLPDRGDIVVEPGANLAGEPRDTLEISALVSDDRAAASPIPREALRAFGAAIRTVQIAGAVNRVTELTLRYAQDRVQFGRPLSKFQAIQQNLAVLATQAAVCAMAATMAADALADEAPAAIAIAKARAGEAAGVAAGIAHQVHGAIGFTLEHDLQFFTKRLLSWRDEFGNEAEWNLYYGRLIAAAGGEGLWPAITAAA